MKQIYMQSKTPENNQVNFNPKTNRMKSSIASKGDEGKREAIERMKNLNIFLIQNKGKGPPGRSRSPGAESYPEHPPDSEIPIPIVLKGRPVKAKGDEPFEITIHTEQTFFTNNKSQIFTNIKILLS